MKKFLAAAGAALLLGLPAANAAPPRVAAASSLKFALEAIVKDYERETGRAVTIAFGSSGNLRHQIAAGAPFELFLSADEDSVLALANEGRLEDRGVRYASGRLVLYAPKGSPVDPALGIAGLASLIRSGAAGKVAIANPAHAPYGRAALEALKRAGAWEAVSPRLALGESVAQAAQFAVSGNAIAGFLAQSLALSPAVSGRGRHALVPEAAHAPLLQRMALVRGAGDDARAFYRYLQSDPARATLARHGYGVPAP